MPDSDTRHVSVQGHTPGPWFSLERNPARGLDIRGGNHHHAIAQAKSYWNGPGPREAEALANCDLIAASPDMLAALEPIERILGFAEWSDPAHAEEILTQLIKLHHGPVQAAVNKARGRS